MLAFSILGCTALLATSGCVERVEQAAPDPLAEAAAAHERDGDSVVERFAGERMSFGVLPPTPVQAAGEPIRIGMINQEDTPLGSFPELRLGAEAAVAFVNAELGGVHGRPLELVTCITSFSVEMSQACAQQMVLEDVIAVAGGIDITSNGAIPVLEQNGIPLVGGIPINLDEMRSPISFQFSGGAAGAFVAFAQHAADSGADKVAVVYGEFPPIKTAAVDFGAATARALGLEVVEVPFPITSTDFLPVLTKAGEDGVDAIFLAAADTACAPAMKTAHDLGITATMYLVGACAAPAIAERVGPDAVEGRIFNVEGPVDTADREGMLYVDVVGTYGDPTLPPASAATVSFRGVMNLYALLQDLPSDRLDRESLLDLARSARHRASFNGHDYTCDGRQIPALPAICAPQQVLVRSDGRNLRAVTGWVDVPEILRRTGTGQ